MFIYTSDSERTNSSLERVASYARLAGVHRRCNRRCYLLPFRLVKLTPLLRQCHLSHKWVKSALKGSYNDANVLSEKCTDPSNVFLRLKWKTTDQTNMSTFFSGINTHCYRCYHCAWSKHTSKFPQRLNGEKQQRRRETDSVSLRQRNRQTIKQTRTDGETDGDYRHQHSDSF